MSQDFDRALFQATFSNFLNQIFQKQLQANKIQLDLIRIYEGKTQNTSTHLHIIKNCRKTIQTTDCILKDIRDYFTDLKIPQIYCLFETLFRNLVYTLKTLSQCYLYRFDSNRAIRDKASQQKIPQQTVVQLCETKQINQMGLIPQKNNKDKQNARRMEQLDFIINSIQAKQSQLESQMHLLIPNVKDEKQKIEKIDATVRSAYYEEMMKIFSDISNRAQYIFSNHLRTQNQLDNKNFGCMKPEDLEYEIYSQLRTDGKYKAKKKFEQIFSIIVNIFKEKLLKKFEIKEAQLQKTVKFLKKEKQDFIKSQKSRRYVKLKSNKSIKKKQSQHDISIQKQLDQKLALKIQQNQSLIKENQQLKRQIKMLSNQIQQHKLNIKKQKLQYTKLQFQNKQLQKLFKKRTIQLEQSKNELHVTINKRVRESAILSRSSQLKPEGINQKNANKILKASMQQRETQTEQQHNFSDDLFNCSLAFEHKSFVSMRTKHKKHSQNKEDISNEKNKFVKAENNLKIVLEKISELLFKEKTANQINEEDKHTIFNLIQSQNYDQAIQIMKEKLDHLFYTSLNSNNNIALKKVNKKIKSHNKKLSQKIVNNSIQQLNINSLKFISFGVQTQRIQNSKDKKMVQNFTAIHSSNRQKLQKNYKNNHNRKKIASNQQFNLVLNKQQSQIKTQRVSPIGSIISRFNSQLDKRGNKRQKQNWEDKRLINRFRNSEGQSFLKENKQNQNESTKKKIKFLQNSLFEQINLNCNQSIATPKRNIMMKTPRLKFKQNVDPIQREGKQGRKIVTELPQQNELVQCGETIYNNIKTKQIDNINLVVEVMKGIGMLKQFDEKNSEKLLIQVMKASSSFGQVKVNQAIKIYKQYQMSPTRKQKL